PSLDTPATAWAAIFWGPKHRLKCSQQVPGDGSHPRALLWATALAVRAADPGRILRISTTEGYVHRTLGHWAAIFAAQGWPIPHADILRPLTDLLRARPAPLRL
ncbi:hypothetical protein BV20DRAFT_931140, partial [Pilatotrama ljubarskyi]